MNTNSIFGLMDILIIGAGLYIVYAWYLLKFRGEIKEGVLVPQGWASRCKDIDGYRNFISNKLLALGLSRRPRKRRPFSFIPESYRPSAMQAAGSFRKSILVMI